MAYLLIKDIPRSMRIKLWRRAFANGRGIDAEAAAILEATARGSELCTKLARRPSKKVGATMQKLPPPKMAAQR
jgi:plasmid stability protein